MIPEIDIWRCAQLMIRQYGDHAAIQADIRAGGMIDEGDTTGGAICQRIRQAVEHLQKDMPDGAVH